MVLYGPGPLRVKFRARAVVPDVVSRLDLSPCGPYPPRVATVVETEALRASGAAGGRSSSAGVHATLQVLDLLAAHAPLQQSELARRLGIAKSTVHRICAVLLERGWLIRTQDGALELGIRALRLGSRSSDLPLVTAFRSVAADFLTTHDETLALAVLDGAESLYLALEETSQPVRLATHVGSKTPAFASASGRAVLAGERREEVERMFAGRPLVTPTGRRLNGTTELHAILERVRRDGYAENRGETAVGLYAASVAIANGRGETLAALTTCIPLCRVTDQRRERVLADLADAGCRLSSLVEWLPSFSARS